MHEQNLHAFLVVCIRIFSIWDIECEIEINNLKSYVNNKTDLRQKN